MSHINILNIHSHISIYHISWIENISNLSQYSYIRYILSLKIILPPLLSYHICFLTLKRVVTQTIRSIKCILCKTFFKHHSHIHKRSKFSTKKSYLCNLFTVFLLFVIHRLGIHNILKSLRYIWKECQCSPFKLFLLQWSSVLVSEANGRGYNVTNIAKKPQQDSWQIN